MNKVEKILGVIFVLSLLFTCAPSSSAAKEEENPFSGEYSDGCFTRRGYEGAA